MVNRNEKQKEAWTTRKEVDNIYTKKEKSQLSTSYEESKKQENMETSPRHTLVLMFQQITILFATPPPTHKYILQIFAKHQKQWNSCIIF